MHQVTMELKLELDPEREAYLRVKGECGVGKQPLVPVWTHVPSRELLSLNLRLKVMRKLATGKGTRERISSSAPFMKEFAARFQKSQKAWEVLLVIKKITKDSAWLQLENPVRVLGVCRFESHVHVMMHFPWHMLDEAQPSFSLGVDAKHLVWVPPQGSLTLTSIVKGEEEEGEDTFDFWDPDSSATNFKERMNVVGSRSGFPDVGSVIPQEGSMLHVTCQLIGTHRLPVHRLSTHLDVTSAAAAHKRLPTAVSLQPEFANYTSARGAVIWFLNRLTSRCRTALLMKTLCC